MKWPALWLLVLMSVYSEAQQTSPGKPPASVQHAEWSQPVQQVIGLGRSDFEQFGLSRLTKDQFFHLVMFIDKQESAQRYARYIYEPSPPKYQKVRTLVIDSSETSNAEVMSAIRQRLRSISDVEVVYSRSEADLEIDILTLDNKLEGSGRAIGYTASVVTTTPCQAEFGDRKWDTNFSGSHFVHVSSSASNLADGIVSEIDTHDFESVRSLHAAEAKAFSSQ